MSRATGGLTQRQFQLIAPGFFVVGATAQYLGAAWAVELFRHVAPESVAWLRVCGAAIVLCVLVPPWKRVWSREQLSTAALFGCSTALMNIAFYLAARRLPLGTTVAIEFVGPIAVAGVASRSLRSRCALLLAASGVVLVSGVHWSANALGVVFALAAALCWASYIVLGQRVSNQTSGLDGLALALAIGAIAGIPIGVWHSGPAWHTPRWLLLCVAIGVMSTIIPYGIDQMVLRRVARHSFSLMLALLPTTAVVVGAVVLHQRLHVLEVVGIAAVVGALLLNGSEELPTPIAEGGS